MRATLNLFVLSACLAIGQESSASRVFKLHHVQSDQDINEFATMIRSISDMPQVNSDKAQKTISVTGTPTQVAIAEYLFTELDRSALPKSATQEFRVPNNTDDVVRVFFAPNAATVQNFQEIATTIRTVAEIRRIFTYNSVRALAVRGTADQASVAAWMIRELDQPADAKRTNPPAYKMIDTTWRPEPVVRIFYLPYTSTVQQFQEVATMIRTIVETRRLFTYNAPRAMVVRGDEGEIAAAEWLVGELGKPTSPEATASETYDYGDDKVRIFYVKDVPTVQAFQQVATQIRTITKMRRVFTYNATMAMAVRGTAAQLATADQMLKDRQIAKVTP